MVKECALSTGELDKGVLCPGFLSEYVHHESHVPIFFTETFLPRKQEFCLVMRFYVHHFVMNISYLDQHDKSIFIIINTHLLT